MTYKILRNGEDLGTATPEELRQRIAAGELKGDDLVSTGESPEWRRVDSLAQSQIPSEAPPLLPGASPVPVKKAKKAVVVAICLCALLLLAAAGIYVRRNLIPPPPPPAKQVDPVAVASQPIPIHKTPTVHDVAKRVRAFELRQWLAGYQKRGVHGAVPDPKIEEYIRVYVDRRNEGPEASSTLSLDNESDRLAHDPNCNDPLVLALVATNTLNWYDQMALLKRLLPLFPGSKHLAFPALYANVNLMTASKYEYDKEGELNSTALVLLEKCFQDGSFRPEDQQEIASIFIDTWGTTFFSKNDAAVCDIVKRQGPEYRWLALVLDGDRDIVEAWEARGGGYRNTVTDEQWAEYRRLLKVGGVQLSAAWNLHPDYPLAPSLLIYDSLGSGITDMRLWFDRAVTAQIDYPGAWQNIRWGLRSRWYGNNKALMALGVAAIKTGRFDTDVPHEYFNCAMDVESDIELPSGHRIFEVPELWGDFQKMYEGYIADPSQAQWRVGWRNSYAAVSYLAKHYDVTRKQMEALDWKLLPNAITSWGTDLTAMPIEVAARTGPLAADVKAAEEARASGDRATALRLFVQLDSRHSSDSRTNDFIHYRLARMTNEQHLAEGKWISLMPDKTRDPNWSYNFGDPKRNDDGSLDVEYGPKGHMLYPKITVGPDFEVRGSFDVLRSTNTNFQGGIVIGLPNIKDLNWFGFRLKRHDVEGDLVCFGLGWSFRDMTVPVTLNDKTNTFDLIMKDGQVTASVNGQLIFEKADPPSTIDFNEDNYFVGLGAFSDSADAVIRYHGVELRRLSAIDEATLSTPVTSRPFSPAPEEEPAAPAVARTVSEQIEADKAEMSHAIDKVKLIVNRPAVSLPINADMNVTRWSDIWFHPGASVPDYGKVDITKTQEFPYAKAEYVTSKLHPGVAFLARDLEFNSMTKYFYTDWTVPKKRLSASEMKEVNRLYKVIARCEADLKRLEAD